MSSAIWGVRLGEVGLGAPAAAGEDGFQDVRAHANLPAEDVGHQRARLAGIEGDLHQEPSQPGAQRAHLPPDRLLDDRLQEHRVLDVQLLAHGLAQEGRAGGRDAQAFLPGNPVDLSLDLARSTQMVTRSAAVLCWVFVIEQRNCPTAACARPQSEAQAGRNLGARSPLRPYLALHHEVVVLPLLDMIGLRIYPARCVVVRCS